jgi:hypothetical protein
MVNVLSFDPGGEQGAGASGWCYQSADKVFAMGDTQDLKGFLKKWDLKKLPVDHVVVEGYFIPPRKDKMQANIGVKLTTVENIGVVKLWAEMMDIPWTEYMPAKKSSQCKLTGVYPKRGRKDVSHKLDAYNHGRYYLIMVHKAPTALEIEMQKNGGKVGLRG